VGERTEKIVVKLKKERLYGRKIVVVMGRVADRKP